MNPPPLMACLQTDEAGTIFKVDAFVASHWNEILGKASRDYEASGTRGAVTIEWSTISLVTDRVLEHIDATLAGQIPVSAEIPVGDLPKILLFYVYGFGDEDAGLTDAIASYDVGKEVVVSVVERHAITAFTSRYASLKERGATAKGGSPVWVPGGGMLWRRYFRQPTWDELLKRREKLFQRRQ
jgi:hypothetical protein